MHLSHRKNNILQQLEMAVKRKVQQRSKETKQIDSKHLLESNQKKPSSSFIPSYRNKSMDKQPCYRQKSPSKEKIPIASFQNTEFLRLNQQLRYQLSDVFIQKKFNNGRMDKVVNLINYVLSSADKVMNHVNISSFEAEFSVKLFLSDKETLLAELDNLKMQDLGFAVSSTQSKFGMKASNNQNNASNNILIIENQSLKAENGEYRKQIMLFEGQIKKLKQEKIELLNQLKLVMLERQKNDLDIEKCHSNQTKQVINLLKQMQQIEEARKHDRLKENQLKQQMALKQKQIDKYVDIIKETLQANMANKILPNISKCTKVGIIKLGNSKQQLKNDKRRGQLELIISGLENQYKDIVNQIQNIQKSKHELRKLVQERHKKQLTENQLYLTLSTIFKNNSNISNKVYPTNTDDIKRIKQLENNISIILQEKQHTSQAHNKQVKELERRNKQLNHLHQNTLTQLKQIYSIAQIISPEMSTASVETAFSNIRKFISQHKFLNSNIKQLQIKNSEVQQNWRIKVQELELQIQMLNKQLQCINIKNRTNLIIEQPLEQKQEAPIVALQEECISLNQSEIQSTQHQPISNQKVNIQIQKIQEQLTQIYSEITKVGRQHHLRQSQLTEKLINLETQLKQKEQKILSDQLIKFEERQQIYQSKIQQLQKERQVAQNKRLEHQRQQILKQQRQKFLNIQIQVLKQQVQKHYTTIQQLRHQKQQLSVYLEKLIQQQRLFENVKQELQRVRYQNNYLIEENEKLKAGNKEYQQKLMTLQSEKDQQKYNQSTKDDTIVRLESQIAEFETKIQRIVSQKEHEIQQVTLDFASQIKNSENKIQFLQNKILSLEQQKIALNQSNTQLNQEIDRLQNEESHYKIKIRQFQEEIHKRTQIQSAKRKQSIQIHRQLMRLKQIEVQFVKLQQKHRTLIEKQNFNNCEKVNQKKIQHLTMQLIHVILEVDGIKENDLTSSLIKAIQVVKQTKIQKHLFQKQTFEQLKLRDNIQQQNVIRQEFNSLQIKDKQPQIIKQKTNEQNKNNIIPGAEQIGQLQVPDQNQHLTQSKTQKLKENIIQQVEQQLENSQLSPIRYSMNDDYQPLSENKEPIEEQNKEQRIQNISNLKEQDQEEFQIHSSKHMSIQDIKKISVLDKSDIIEDESKSKNVIEQIDQQLSKSIQLHIKEPQQDKNSQIKDHRQQGEQQKLAQQENLKNFKGENVSQQDSSNTYIQTQLKQIKQLEEPKTSQEESEHRLAVYESQFNDIEQSQSQSNSIMQHQPESSQSENKQQTSIQQSQKNSNLVLTQSLLKNNQLSQSQFKNFKEPALSQSMVSNEPHETHLQENSNQNSNQKHKSEIINNISPMQFSNLEHPEISKSIIQQSSETQQNERILEQQQQSNHQKKQEQSNIQNFELKRNNQFEDFENEQNDQLDNSNVQACENNFEDFKDQPHQPLNSSIISENQDKEEAEPTDPN